MNLQDLYRHVILDHSQRPRNRHALANALAVRLLNPTCGDEVTLYLTVEQGVVADASFEGVGCSISIASASMLTEAVRGLPLSEALVLSRAFRRLVQGEDADVTKLGDLEALSGVRQFPARIKCALLAWNALEQGIRGEPDEP
ncbi:SUF system NifU family Fe-S cluster assembly protein [Tumebacillus sp. DT12]|uniref:SUF system NifU family Fe-S cluster assembly protein n=1 Tax=Tumebacillus lacus TaxID=2995335 RepID=A0ABT3WZG4_9BACL|nr:SUF system NifU family Fe-S cluster assembly protein [Tumebacillus lacus]MCX7570048.1 SUF system NifU family Fe-S cluster assembly protein [Tumebacillus lacus]